MTIKIFWRLFCYGIKIYHYDYFIGIWEFLEKLSLYCFNNPFTTDTGNAEIFLPLLDEVDDRQTFYNHHSIHFSISVSCSTQGINISDLNLNSA